MIRKIIYLIIALLLFVTNSNAQDKNFETKMKSLSTQMDEVIQIEKHLLKKEIKAIEKQYNKDKITFEEAEKQKKAVTELHANNIKTKIASIETQIHNLVQGKTDAKIKAIDNKKEDDYLVIDWNSKKRQLKKKKRKNKRTYYYLVFAMGYNNLIDDGDINSVNDSAFKLGGSHFYEVGLNYKTRLMENSGLMYINYGLSLRYNNLRTNNNSYFVVDNDKTNLEVHAFDLSDSRMKNVQLVAPVFFEFDFSKPKTEKGKTIYRRNRSFRLGFGGFAGINLKTKQFLEYSKDGVDYELESKGDYNVNTFVYGVQGLIGYKDISLYVKYDMQDLFAKSFKNQKNISLGVRFDL